MPQFNTLIVVIMVGSVIVYLATVMMTLSYNKKYCFQEDKYTKLFGHLVKEHILYIYFVYLATYIILTIWFLWTL